MDPKTAQELLLENSRVGLVLAMNAILAVANAKLLLPGQAERCATEMRTLAKRWDEASDAENPPGKLSVDLQTVAALIDPQGKPPRD